MKKQELAVGDSTELEIIFSTGQRRGPASKSPSIQTNEGPPQRRVTIRANVIAQPDSTYPVVIKPYRVYVSRAGEVEVDESKFNVSNVSDQDLEVSVVGQPPGYFQLDIPKTVKAGESIECLVKVNPEFLADAFEKAITLEFSDLAHTRFTIPVVRRIIGSQKESSSAGGGK